MLQKVIRNIVLLFVILFLSVLFSDTPVFGESDSYPKPSFTSKDLRISPFAFVYGDIANLDNVEDPYYAIDKLQDLPYIVCAEPGELSKDSKLVTDKLKPNTKLFGYVNLGPNNPEDSRQNWQIANLDAVKAEIDNIAESEWYGVFIDQFGYDFQETRDRQNEIVDYAHQKALRCFVNAWFPDDVMGSGIRPHNNPQGKPTHLQAGDYYLIESFLMSGSSYRGDLSYLDKFLKVKAYQDTLGINTVVLSYKRDNTSWTDTSDDITLSYILAQCLGYEGWWFGGLYGSTYFNHLNPLYDIGKVLQPLHHISETLYRTETEYYTIEYYADEVPHMIAFPKRLEDPIITIRHSIPDDYIDTNLFTFEEALATQKRLNDYGFTDVDKKILKEDGIFSNSSRSALNQFIQANSFVYYSTQAKDTLSGIEAINVLGETGELSFMNKTKFFFASKFKDLEETIDIMKDNLRNKAQEFFSLF
ncbi:MAG: hypothetical protein APF84_10680 [Gracilibacter sp. BRH_c7a]|nr:MAG: hypothetical protein APF84_10680 [Gracilibacter sp. BRH_c7a]